MFGLPTVPWGPLGVMGGTDTRPTNTPEDMTALQKLYAAVAAQNHTPQGRINRGFNQFGPQGGAAPAAQAAQPAAAPVAPAPQMLPPVTVPDEETPNSHVAQGFGALSSRALAPAAPAPVAPVAPPPPQIAAAPPAPPPAAPDVWGPSGTFGAPQSVNLGPQQASGPDVIQKLMSYFHNKGNPSDG